MSPRSSPPGWATPRRGERGRRRNHGTTGAAAHQGRSVAPSIPLAPAPGAAAPSKADRTAVLPQDARHARARADTGGRPCRCSPVEQGSPELRSRSDSDRHAPATPAQRRPPAVEPVACSRRGGVRTARCRAVPCGYASLASPAAGHQSPRRNECARDRRLAAATMRLSRRCRNGRRTWTAASRSARTACLQRACDVPAVRPAIHPPL